MGKSGSSPVTTSLPPCLAPADPEVEGDADNQTDSEAPESDSAVVALPHHAIGHPHPAVHPAAHPAAHVARVDERTERRTARGIIHHVNKQSTDKSGSSPVNNT